MEAPSPPLDPVPFRRPDELLDGAGADAAARIIAAAGDVALLIEADGIIRDVAVAEEALRRDGLARLIGRDWRETVTADSRRKVDEMIADALGGKPARWRQINQRLSGERETPLRFLALKAGKRVVAIGRDLRATAALQQRLLQAQQSMERDYVRLRQAESRYRLLFELGAEAVLIVDAASRRITEANPAAQAIAGGQGALAGQSLASILHIEDRDAAVALLGGVAASGEGKPIAVRVAKGRRAVSLSATLFRQDRGSFFLVRLTPESKKDAAAADPRTAERVLEQIPDAFVLTDEALNVVALNTAFLDLAGAARRDDVIGAPLVRFVGRPGIDLNLLASQLREHGSVSRFHTIVRGGFAGESEVELSAVAASDGEARRYGISMRTLAAPAVQTPLVVDGPRSVEQLTKLVGRVSLKEIVRESTDLIERLCIEAALQYTDDNRASAAEILGLSRQSLYSKLHRHGLGNVAGDVG